METSHNDHSPLHILFHDVYKAFDLTQWWVLQLACDRFAIPKQFQTFLLNYLRTSKTYIQTLHGPTSLLQLLNSVKQGDPLAGILYNLTLDVPHTLASMLLPPPLPTLPLRSLGYADDICNLSKSAKLMNKLSAQTHLSLSLQTTKLNTTKTQLISLYPEPTPILLAGCTIHPIPFQDSVKFLGVRIHPDLSWTDQLNHLVHKQLYPVMARLRTQRIPYQQAIYTYQDIILSFFNHTAKFAPIPLKQIKDLDKQIFKILHDLDPAPFCGHLRSGFYSSHHILPLKSHLSITQISETLFRLNDPSDYGYSARLQAQKLLSNNILQPARNTSNRIIYAVRAASKEYNLDFHDNTTLHSSLQTNPTLHRMIQDHHADGRLSPLHRTASKHKTIFLSSHKCPHSSDSIWILRWLPQSQLHPVVGRTHSDCHLTTLLIGLLYCLESIPFTRTSTIILPLPKLLTDIQAFSSLPSRRQQRHPRSYYLRRLTQLIHYKQLPSKCICTTSQPSIYHQLPSDIVIPFSATSVIQLRVGAPFYFLASRTDSTPIDSCPRRFLSHYCKAQQTAAWQSSNSLQSTHIQKHHRLLSRLISYCPFEIKTQPHFSATLNNRLPTMRIFRHPLPLTDKSTPCLLCHLCHSQSHNAHLLLCPSHQLLLSECISQTATQLQTQSISPSKSLATVPNPYKLSYTYLYSCLTKSIPYSVPHFNTLIRPPLLALQLQTWGTSTQRQPSTTTELHRTMIEFLQSIATPTTIIAYTDGSKSPTTHRAGSAAILTFPSRHPPLASSLTLSRPEILYAEVHAILLCLELTLTHIHRFPLHKTIYILTDCNDTLDLVLSTQPPTKFTSLVLATRTAFLQLSRHLTIHIHWIGSHAGLPGNEHAHTLACTAASKPIQLPSFPLPQPLTYHVITNPHFLTPQTPLDFHSSILPQLSPTLAHLVAALFLQHLQTHTLADTLPHLTAPLIQAFTTATESPELPWRDCQLLVTALRVPYVDTPHPSLLPHNTVGWMCSQCDEKCFEILGRVEDSKICNRLILDHQLSVADVSRLVKLHDTPKNIATPWRLAFFVPQRQYIQIERLTLKEAKLQQIASFHAADGSTFHLVCIDNALARVVDDYLLSPLRKWLKQFPTHSLNPVLEKPTPHTIRRCI